MISIKDFYISYDKKFKELDKERESIKKRLFLYIDKMEDMKLKNPDESDKLERRLVSYIAKQERFLHSLCLKNLELEEEYHLMYSKVIKYHTSIEEPEEDLDIKYYVIEKTQEQSSSIDKFRTKSNADITSTGDTLDIVYLIQNAPIESISDTSNSILLRKIQENFTDQEQQLFIGSFYCYLNHKDNEYVINMRDVFEWCGFTRMDNAIRLLKKYFKQDEHFIVNGPFPPIGGKPKGGRPQEDYLLTITTFKKFCMRSNTKKANEIYDYFIKLEKIYHETIKEEMDNAKNQSLIEVAKEREIHLLEKFKDCVGVYFLNNPILRLCKFGSSKNVSKRVKEHRRDFGDEFRLHHVVKTPKYADLENGVRRFQNTEHNGHVEIIQYTNNDELQSIYKNTERESRLLSYEESNDLEIRKMEHHIESEKEKTKQMELEVEKLRISLEIMKIKLSLI